MLSAMVVCPFLLQISNGHMREAEKRRSPEQTSAQVLINAKIKQASTRAPSQKPTASDTILLEGLK